MKPKIPSLNNFILFSLLAALITILFTSIYFSTNFYAGNVDQYAYFFEFEKLFPFIPGFILIYLSLNILMTMPLFYLENKNEIIDYAGQIIIGTIIAGVFFVIFPGKLGFERILPDGLFYPVYRQLFEIDAPHNLAPSLHIIYTYITVFVLINKTKSKVWHIWGGLMCMSVVLTHQHHLIDVVSGLLLSLILSNVKASKWPHRGLKLFHKI